MILSTKLDGVAAFWRGMSPSLLRTQAQASPAGPFSL